jgi:hypothetical protein
MERSLLMFDRTVAANGPTLGRYSQQVTCVCAVADGASVLMGGDSAMTNGDGDQTLRSPKVFERSGLLFGVSGEMRIGQLIRHVHEVAAISPGQDVEQFVVRDLCGALRMLLREQADELLPASEDDEMWQLLVGIEGRVFRICSHFSVSESATGYDAIGSAVPPGPRVAGFDRRQGCA